MVGNLNNTDSLYNAISEGIAAENKEYFEKNKKPIYEFDRLKMYFGEPYTIKCNEGEITIYEPTIGGILKFGEKDFYSMLNIFVSNTTTYRLQLWDVGIDWNKISDYELFCMLIKGLNKESTRLLFGDIDFSTFDLYSKVNNNVKLDGNVKKDKKDIFLYSIEHDIELSEDVYKCMSEYLRTMFNIHPKVELARGKSTKQAIIDEDRMNLNIEIKNNRDKNNSKSMLLPLISSCINHPGFKYKLNELKDMGIVQFMDSVQRLQIYENTTALLRGMYSGMIDMKNIDKSSLNFMRDLEYSN